MQHCARWGRVSCPVCVFAKMLKKCRRVKQHVQRDKRLLMAKRNKRGGHSTDVRVAEISDFKFVNQDIEVGICFAFSSFLLHEGFQTMRCSGGRSWSKRLMTCLPASHGCWVIYHCYCYWGQGAHLRSRAGTYLIDYPRGHLHYAIMPKSGDLRLCLQTCDSRLRDYHWG